MDLDTKDDPRTLEKNAGELERVLRLGRRLSWQPPRSQAGCRPPSYV